MADQPDNQLKTRVRRYWTDNPMNYRVTAEPGSPQYFAELDRKNIKWGTPLEDTTNPQGQGLIDYQADIAGKVVLEVGTGLGSLFGSLARRARLAVGIDLTAFGAGLTLERMRQAGIAHAFPVTADAENLPFSDQAFDTVVSWGVIHHTPDTPRAAREIWRVLKPGGTALVMIYHRHSVFFWYKLVIGWGIARGELLRGSLQDIANRHIDPNSPLSKVYSRQEAQQMFGMFRDVQIKVVGDAGFGGLPISRFPFVTQLLRRLGWYDPLVARHGFFLWIRAVK